MWWVGFVAGGVIGALMGFMLCALMIAAGDERHGKR